LICSWLVSSSFLSTSSLWHCSRRTDDYVLNSLCNLGVPSKLHHYRHIAHLLDCIRYTSGVIMRYLFLLLCISCGSSPVLVEGLYSVDLVMMQDSCIDMPGDSAVSIQWDVSRAGKWYGFYHTTNHRSIPGMQTEDRIQGSNSYPQMAGYCKYEITQTIDIELDSDTAFTGKLFLEFLSCAQEYCAYDYVIDGIFTSTY